MDSMLQKRKRPARPPRIEFGSPPLNIVGGAEDVLDLTLARRLCDYAPMGTILADGQGRCIYSNAACQQLSGLSLDQTLGKRWSELVHPNDRQRTAAEWLEASREQQPFQTDVRIERPDASIVWARLHAAAVQSGSAPGAYLLMIEDISERKAAESVLRESEETLFQEKERAQVTLDSIGDAVLATDLAGTVTYMNREAESLTGWSSEEALGRPLAEVFHIVDGETLETARNPARQAIEEDRTVGLALGCMLLRRDRSGVAIEDSAAPIHNRDGTVAGAVIVFHDVAQSRIIAEENAYLARHDHLTGLANTLLLKDRLAQAIGLAYRHSTRVGLLFIDLDRFKLANDAHGHLVGDELLKSVATRLGSCVRATDTVCRRGGDEFVILMAELACREDAARVAETVLTALSAPHVIGETAVKISASIGISTYPDDGDDVTSLMRGADRAMYRAKAGVNGYCFAEQNHARPAIAWRAGRPPRAHRVEYQTTAVPYYLKLEKSS